jgi:hypothetical protein
MITPNRNSSGWESGCGPADPALSKIQTAPYLGTGYAVVPAGEVGNINPGANTPVTPGPPPAQTRMFIQGNNLVILDNITGTAYAVPLAAQIPQPAIYNPTK